MVSVSIEKILDVLQSVKDPEIPTISVVDLGVVDSVTIDEVSGKIRVEMIPTFAGCPAIHFMQMQAEVCLKDAGFTDVEVLMNRNKAWASDKITELGRRQLLDFGLSPPPPLGANSLDNALEHAVCPNCRSTDTQLKTPFGPTLCRAIHHCNQCGETFEQFKPL